MCPFWACYPLRLSLGKWAAVTPMESPTESPAIYLPPVDSAAMSEPELGLVSGIFGTGFLCLGDNTVKHTTSYAGLELRCHKEFLCPALA